MNFPAIFHVLMRNNGGSSSGEVAIQDDYLLNTQSKKTFEG
jgi:hypothetical protein